MANTLTALIPDFYRALDMVSRELVGFIPAVTLDAQVARAAVGQTVRSFYTTQGTAEDITPGTNPPDTGDQVVGNEAMTIEAQKCVPFRWTGGEQRGVNNGGPGYNAIRVDQIAQAIRVLTNAIEVWCANKFYQRASRAFGTAGTAPFATNQTDLVKVLKILKDNGCPQSDLQCVFDTNAGVNLGSVPNLYKVNEAGDSEFLRQNIMGQLSKFNLRESGGVKTTTKGTGTGYLVNAGGGLAVGTTTITVDTGSGTIVAGDIISFTGDTNKYVVQTALAAGTVLINRPGLVKAVADNAPITVENNYTANMAFHRSALILATRVPDLPDEGDMAADRKIVTDPRSGLSFELAMYLQYKRVRYEVGIAWGAFNIKPEHSAILEG
jgi:hypothetical protein